MSYGNKTDKYKLPYPQLGDILDDGSEQVKALTIDNTLFGIVRAQSGGHGIVRLPSFSIVFDSGTASYTVVGSENKSQGKQLEAFINQIYVNTVSALRWQNLSNATRYYLYVRLIESSTNSSLAHRDIQTDYNTTGIVPVDGILVAIVSINEPGNSVIIDPADKISLPVWGDHIVNAQNPHTPYLMQDSIVCSGLNVLDVLRYNQLQVTNFVISGNQIISGNITVLGKMILSGSVAIQGNVVYNLLQVQNLTVPNNFLVGALNVASGLDVYSASYFRTNVQLASGITIDSFDPSEALPLTNGSNADHLHTHLLGSIAVGIKPIQLTPEYPNTVISGEVDSLSGTFYAKRDLNNNFYQWFSVLSGAAIPVSRIVLPQDFASIDSIQVTHGMGRQGGLSGTNFRTEIYDKDNTQVTVTPNQFSGVQVTTTKLTISGGQFLPQYPMTVATRMHGVSGIPSYLGDLILWYVPINGEKIQFDWQKGSTTSLSIDSNIDGLREAPTDLRIEKILVSQTIALSGATVFDIKVGNVNAAPTSIFTSTGKPTLLFGATGKSYMNTELIPTENLNISKNQNISISTNLVASGSKDLSLQLITHRV